MGRWKINWKKVLSVTSWSLAGLLLIVLIVAAETNESGSKCKGVYIQIKSKNDVRYIQEKEILQIISENANESFVGKKLNGFDLKKKEELLEKNLWIRNADIYVDHHDSLRIIIEQRVPVARVYCKDQSTFYIDDQGVRLPFSFNQIISVPVFTSFPESAQKLNKADSLLLMQIRDMGLFLFVQPVWKAQIEQIDLEGSNMIIIPKVGQHEILFGEGVQIEQKFKRLNIFYKNIINKSGWNYYSRIDLRFNKLLIGTRRDSASLFSTVFIPLDTFSQKISSSPDLNIINDSVEQNDFIKVQPSPNDSIKKTINNQKDTILPKRNKPENSQKNENKPKAVMTPQNRKDSTYKPIFYLHK
jgi:cell division protein FtsQ